MEHAPYLTGQVLLAMPGIGDPRFERAAIAMCAHDDEGALGIGVGATVQGIGLHDLLSQFEIEPGAAPNVPLHFGGRWSRAAASCCIRPTGAGRTRSTSPGAGG